MVHCATADNVAALFPADQAFFSGVSKIAGFRVHDHKAAHGFASRFPLGEDGAMLAKAA